MLKKDKRNESEELSKKEKMNILRRCFEYKESY